MTVEYRWAEGRAERFAEIAAEFVSIKVDVIFAMGTERRLRQSRRPLLSPLSFRLRGTRSAVALSLPGATGRERHWPVKPSADLAAKRLDILREVFPISAASLSGQCAVPAGCWKSKVQAAGSTLGIEFIPLEIRAPDIAPAFESLKVVPMLFISSPIR